ncbi:MAG: hypothetical protein IPO21_09155 [Bacteroidales bacterium]|nr:hypothetical protein [Bacteroidales bacterium]
MKKIIISLSMLIATASLSNAQKCSLYEKGQIINSSMKTWFCMKTIMPEWAKMKPADKVKYADEFNENSESGTEKPSYEGKFVTNVKDIISGQGEIIVFSSTINGVEYTSNYICTNDTMFIYRGPSLSFAVVNGDTTGFSTIGVQIIPNNLKVGDILPMYEDYGTTYPKGHNWTQQVMQITGYEKKTKTEYTWATDSRTGESGYGNWEITRNEFVWNLVTVNMKMESQMVMQTKNYVNANVIREEELDIDGNKYKAFVIESQKWVKTGTQSVITSDNAAFQKTFDKVRGKIAQKSNKEIVKMGLQNEQGYAVTYLTEWFVPRIGVVKSQGYDLNGILTQRTSWDNVK